VYEHSANFWGHIFEFVGLCLPFFEWTLESSVQDWGSIAGELFVDSEDFRVGADLEGYERVGSPSHLDYQLKSL
jgi:hypothetical protein